MFTKNIFFVEVKFEKLDDMPFIFWTLCNSKNYKKNIHLATMKDSVPLQ